MNIPRIVAAAEVTGADATATHALVWNSRRAKTYELAGRGAGVGGGDGGYVHVASFKSSRAMAMHRETVFASGKARVEVCTLSGVVKDALAYEATHGAFYFTLVPIRPRRRGERRS